MQDFTALLFIVALFVAGTFCLQDAYNGVHWLNGRAIPLGWRLVFVVVGILVLSSMLNLILVFFLR